MQVYGAGGLTVPKKGRLGTGSYYPNGGTPLFRSNGRCFPVANTVDKQTNPSPTQLTFGDTSRAGIATIAGQNRVHTKAQNPNANQFNLSTQPLAPAMVVSSFNDDNNMQPVSPTVAALSMPQERNLNSAGGKKKTPVPYRTAFGASKSMPVDTAFTRNEGAQYKRTAKPLPGNTKEAVKKSGQKTIASYVSPTPKAGGLSPAQSNARNPVPSFVSHSNLWYDPNNSFTSGQSSMANAGSTGAARWAVVKKGVV